MGRLGAAGTRTWQIHQAQIEFRGQSNQREAVAERRFEVPLPETLQKGERQKQREDEIDDRRRFVLEHVVQAPVGGCGVEAVVLDVPTPMASPPQLPDGQPSLAERRCLVPGRGFLGFLPLAGDSFSALLGFQGMQHPQRLRHAFTGGEALVVSVLDRSPTFGPLPVGGAGRNNACGWRKNSWPSTAANNQSVVLWSILLRLMRRWTSLSTSRNVPLSNCA